MAPSFDYFVMLAEMRTGSNFLEESINSLPSVKCWGEAFNPHFVCHANWDSAAGVSIRQRDKNPQSLLDAMVGKTEGLAGFRFFHDHDPRIFDIVMQDTRCAKIVLTRNPIDSYISLKIARKTGQWRLGNAKKAKSATVRFDIDEFRAYLAQIQQQQHQILDLLQRSGQTAFFIGYDDLASTDAINGLARFLGISGRLRELPNKTKIQNPKSLRQKVENFDQMRKDLADYDYFELSRTPNFEPRRGPNIGRIVVAAQTPLAFWPIMGGPYQNIISWFTELDNRTPLEGLASQKELRKWKRSHTGHLSFTVLRHPVARAHHVFCNYILNPGPQCFEDIRSILRKSYELPIPEDAPTETWSKAAHHRAFIRFAEILAQNLAGRTSFRTDRMWATQAQNVKGFAEFAAPDMLIREEELQADLSHILGKKGIKCPNISAPEEDEPYHLSAIYDAEVESAIRAAYQRDYLMFGFSDWHPSSGLT